MPTVYKRMFFYYQGRQFRLHAMAILIDHCVKHSQILQILDTIKMNVTISRVFPNNETLLRFDFKHNIIDSQLHW